MGTFEQVVEFMERQPHATLTLAIEEGGIWSANLDGEDNEGHRFDAETFEDSDPHQAFVILLGELGIRPASQNGHEKAVPRARGTDPSTSHAAARSVRDLTDKQQAVLGMYVFAGRERPMDDRTLLVAYADARARGLVPEQSESGIRTRRSELVDRGLLVEKDRTTLDSGRQAIVWGRPSV